MNNAEAQCSENLHAFFDYKTGRLFPKKSVKDKHKSHRALNKTMVNALKVMQKSVSMQLPEGVSDKMKHKYKFLSDMPLEYPNVHNLVNAK